MRLDGAFFVSDGEGLYNRSSSFPWNYRYARIPNMAHSIHALMGVPRLIRLR